MEEYVLNPYYTISGDDDYLTGFLPEFSGDDYTSDRYETNESSVTDFQVTGFENLTTFFPTETGFTAFPTGTAPNIDHSTRNFVVIVFKLITFVLGLCGNVFVIMEILISRRYKKVTFWFIMNMAVGQLLHISIYPVKVVELLRNQWIFSNMACKTYATIETFGHYSAVTFLLILSIILYSETRKKVSGSSVVRFSHAFVFIITAASWAISFLLSVPEILFSGVMGFAPECFCRLHIPEGKSTGNLCVNLSLSDGYESSYPLKEMDNKNYFVYIDDIENENQKLVFNTEERTLLISEMVLIFFLPCLVMFVCYLVIFLRLEDLREIKHQSPDSESGLTISNKQIKRFGSIAESEPAVCRRTIAMCFCFFFLYFACWLPINVFNIALLTGIAGQIDFGEQLHNALLIISDLNFATSPLLYIRFVCIGIKIKHTVRSAALNLRSCIERKTSGSQSEAKKQNYESEKFIVKGEKDSTTDERGTMVNIPCDYIDDSKDSKEKLCMISSKESSKGIEMEEL